MARPRFQRGTLALIGEGKDRRWRGKWHIYQRHGSGEKRLAREKILGYEYAVSLREARARLQELINAETKQARIVYGHLNGSALSHTVNPTIAKNRKRGPISELLVAADLLSRGLEVFTAVNPSGPVDLVVMDESQFYRIEVKSVKERTPGKVKRDIRRNASRFDVLALVDGNGVISYVAHAAIKFGSISTIKTDLFDDPELWAGRVASSGRSENSEESTTA